MSTIEKLKPKSKEIFDKYIENKQDKIRDVYKSLKNKKE